ncbi:MAG TPA: arginine--tRNA ligase [Anaerolineaceae bacterium]|nr:arginine--tRNA ligase [Anaerolineaceae bacterium]
MFETEQKQIEQSIQDFCEHEGLPKPTLQWSWIPFSGQWGISTSFFQLAAQEARLGKKINVPRRAQEIAESVAAALGQPTGFEKLEAVKGYLNLYFSTAEYTRRVLDTVLSEGKAFGRSSKNGQRVMVEFSQPNTHKAFHVGHLRNVILGNSVCNILDFAGNEVVRTNYIGDIGLHVIKWLWDYRKYHAGQEPGQDKTRWMGDIYAEADRYYDSSKEVEAEVRALFARWDQRDPEIVALWQKTRQWSLEGFEQIYQLLGVQFDRFYFESEEEEPGKEFVKRMIEKGIARDERPAGAVIVPLDEILGTHEKYRVLVVLRSDGTSLYSTKDLPLAVRKFEEYHLDRSVYVIDVRQSLYMIQIFKTLELMGYVWAKDCYHLAYEIVNLPGNVTMSSRDGTVVLLDDLVREATQRALEIVKTKNPDLSAESQGLIAKAVALGAIKYSMLSRDSTRIVTFDWDAALDFNGQAAPYIQYAHVRASSILRKVAGQLPDALTPSYELSPVEIQLVDLISRLPKEVQKAAGEFRPLYISNLGYDLAKAFNDFYNQCPVLQADEPVRAVRLRIVAAARQAIGNCLGLLGITAPEAM